MDRLRSKRIVPLAKEGMKLGVCNLDLNLLRPSALPTLLGAQRKGKALDQSSGRLAFSFHLLSLLVLSACDP